MIDDPEDGNEPLELSNPLPDDEEEGVLDGEANADQAPAEPLPERTREGPLGQYEHKNEAQLIAEAAANENEGAADEDNS